MNIKLHDHQVKCTKVIQNKNIKGIILKHGLGTGKTITSIACYETLRNRSETNHLKALVVVPAKLIANYEKELEKTKVNKENYDITSYQRVKKPDYEFILILDEAHLIRNASSNISKKIKDISQSEKCYKVLILTGTPMVNYPNDISILLNLVGGNIETSWQLFKKEYVKYIKKEKKKLTWTYPFYVKVNEVKIKIKNKDKLLEKFKNKISCIDADKKYFPRTNVIVKKIVMDNDQLTVYKAMENEHLTEKAKEILNTGEDKNMNILNSFLNKTRSISNVINNNLMSTKIASILEQIKKDDRFPIVIYSFFLESGINAIEKYLSNYSTRSIQGNTSTEDVKKSIEDYNKQKVKILLISGAAGYGLDLKRTSAIHIMEPAWNKAKIDQVIGRGVRYKSHYDLPKNEQYLNIYHWLSVKPQGFFFSKKELSADEYLYDLSIKKDKLLQLFSDLICTVSIENIN